MLHVTIPGREALDLEHVVCDLNGTLAEDGLLLDGVAGRIAQLSRTLSVHVLTADTHGTLAQVVEQLHAACLSASVPSPRCERIGAGEEKARYVTALGAERVAAIGNGANDRAMFRVARLRIGVIGGEGASTSALLDTDVVVTSPLHALDLLLYPERLAATLRL